MPVGLDKLRHIVVLMMENRSFDHMLGALKQVDPRINGLTGDEFNPDTTSAPINVQPLAEYQSQLDPDPDHHFPGVNLQIYVGAGGPPAAPSMQGFIKSYFQKRRDVNHSHKIMYYFPPEKIPILTGLAEVTPCSTVGFLRSPDRRCATALLPTMELHSARSA